MKNADGSISTVRSLGVNIDGKEVLIPTVVDGRVVSDDEAIATYKRTGQHLGVFSSPAASTAYAERLHESEAAKLAGKPKVVDIPGVGAVEFPDSMSNDEISAAAAKLHAESAPSTPTTADMMTGRGAQSNLQEGSDDTRASRLNAFLQPYAHPQTKEDIAHLMMSGSNEVQGVVGKAIEPVLGPVVRGAGRVIGSIAPSADTVRRGAAAVTNVAADVAESPITNIISPRAKHVGELLRRASDAMRKPAVVAEASGTAPGAAGVAHNVQDTPQGSTSGPEPNGPPATAPAPATAPLDRRTVAGSGPGGIDRRNQPLTGSIPERAAAMRAENPNIDAQARAMGEQAAATRTEAPPRNNLPDQRALNEEALAARRAAYQAKIQPQQAVASIQTAAASNVKLTASEMLAGADLVRKGLTPEAALESILQQRELMKGFGLSTPTADAARFPKGMRGKSGSAQRNPPAPTADSGAAWNAQRSATKAAPKPWTEAEGGELFHGTTESRLRDIDNQSEVYFTTSADEASGYAQGLHAPGEARGVPTVVKAHVKPGKAIDITRDISEAMMDDAFDEAWLNARIKQARTDGASYVTYDHPSFLSGDVEQRVIVALHPARDVAVKQSAAWNAQRAGKK